LLDEAVEGRTQAVVSVVDGNVGFWLTDGPLQAHRPPAFADSGGELVCVDVA